MKRLLLLSVLSMTGALLFSSIAVAATPTTTSSKVSPKRDKKKPYKFKTRGTVAVPGGYCTTVTPGPSCIPLKCPPGVKNIKYCQKPSVAAVCTGKVTITFTNAGVTVSSKTVNLTKACKYSSRATIKKKGVLIVSVEFGGNSILAPSSASPKTVRAG